MYEIFFFSLANHRQKPKSSRDSKKVSSQKCSPTSSTNKSFYAYDNLAYGFSNDLKQTSEN